MPRYGGGEGGHDLLRQLHRGRRCDLVRGARVDRQEVRLEKSHVQTLRRASSYDEILLIHQSAAHPLALEVPGLSVLTRYVDGSVLEVPPSENLLRPELERVEKMELLSIGERHLVLAETDEAVDRLVVVVVPTIRNQAIDTVHLHLHLVADRNLAREDLASERLIIPGGCGIGKHFGYQPR